MPTVSSLRASGASWRAISRQMGGGIGTLYKAVLDQGPPKLGHRCNDVELKASCWRGQVDVVAQRDECHTQSFKLGSEFTR